jgi:hypothetical protein
MTEKTYSTINSVTYFSGFSDQRDSSMRFLTPDFFHPTNPHGSLIHIIRNFLIRHIMDIGKSSAAMFNINN